MGLLPMDLDILPPSDDRVFKLILTAPDAKPVLMDLISSIIQRPVVRVRDTVNEVIASKEALQMAGNLLMSISQDERERAVFRSRRMYQTDYESDMATSWDNGKREGMEIGRREGIEIERRNSKMEFARKMLRRNRPLEEIMEDTGLTHDEIERIRSEIS